MISMRECPKFCSCSAPVCPLDPDWPERTVIENEAVCFYMLELAKKGGRARVAPCTPAGMCEQVDKVFLEVLDQPGSSYISRMLRRAATTGSRIAAGQGLHDKKD